MNNTFFQASSMQILPGCFDSMTAALIEQAGFPAAYLSGASVAYTLLGKPDVGYVTLPDMSNIVFRITSRVNIPLIVDADTGYGNEHNAIYAVQVYEKAGAFALQLEDQTFPKRCGHLAGKSIIPTEEMVNKIKATKYAANDIKIIARTDAIDVTGLDDALDRVKAYVKAGADAIFAEAMRTEEHLTRVRNAIPSHIPMIYNYVEGGKSGHFSPKLLESVGVNICLFPGALTRVMSYSAQHFLQALKQDKSSDKWLNHMNKFDDMLSIVNFDEFLNNDKRFSL